MSLGTVGYDRIKKKKIDRLIHEASDTPTNIATAWKL